MNPQRIPKIPPKEWNAYEENRKKELSSGMYRGQWKRTKLLNGFFRQVEEVQKAGAEVVFTKR